MIPRLSGPRSLKSNLKTGKLAEFSAANVRTSLYRPFTKSLLYFDRMMNECVYVFPSIFPTTETEKENRVICFPSLGSSCRFLVLFNKCNPEFDNNGHRWGISVSRSTLTTKMAPTAERTSPIGHWRSFKNTTQMTPSPSGTSSTILYGLLHHPEYREQYQENLKRDLPHIPFAEDFWAFAKAGALLADLHVNYESQPEYAELEPIETPGMQVNLRVERMKFSKDKTRLTYNDFLTLEGIPPEVFDYRLGNRSALEWVVDQYRVKMDKRSGIENDPNRAEDAEYIVRLIGQVITVSLGDGGYC